MKKVAGLKFIGALCLSAIFASAAIAQCENFTKFPRGEQQGKIEHSKYRDYMKQINDLEKNTTTAKAEKDAKFAELYASAFPIWSEVFQHSPNGSEWHFVDGVSIYEYKAETATDEAAKKENFTKVVEMYDRYMQCYPKKKADILRKQANIMVYKLNQVDMNAYNKYKEHFTMLKNGASSYAFEPYLFVATQLFAAESITKEEMREIYGSLNDIADYNIANNAKEKARFEAAKTAVSKYFQPIEFKVFDCEYFSTRYQPDFKKRYNDLAYLENEMLANLRKAQCGSDNELVSAIVKRINDYRDSTKVANRDNKTWGDMALSDNKYDEAIGHYEKAIREDQMSTKDKADLKIRIAKIYMNQKQLGRARQSANEAADLDPSNGEPYILIGNIIMSSSCGDNFDRQAAAWAAIDQYNKAKSVDSSVAGKANELISRYSSYTPKAEDCFQRNLSNGSSYTISCLGVTVRVRY